MSKPQAIDVSADGEVVPEPQDLSEITDKKGESAQPQNSDGSLKNITDPDELGKLIYERITNSVHLESLLVKQWSEITCYSRYVKLITEPPLWKLEFSAIKRHSSDGRYTCIFEFDRVPEKKIRTIQYLARTQLTMRSQRSIKTVAASIFERDKLMDVEEYAEIIEHAANKAIDVVEQGQPIEELDTQDAVKLQASYLLEPLVYQNQPNIIYGEGGSAKSYLALACLILCSIPMTRNPLEFTPQKATGLYLEYELLGKEEVNRRVKLICNGLGLPNQKFLYRSCEVPLHQESEKIKSFIEERNVDFVVIDSLGMAANKGELTSTESAMSFFQALKTLNTTSLIVAHPPKNVLQVSSSIFGSVFFTNLSRNIWEMQKQDSDSETGMDILLVHHKDNFNAKQKPICLKFNFSENSVTIFKQSSEIFDDLQKHLPLKQQIFNYLLQIGKATKDQVARALGHNAESVRVILYRLQKQEKVGYTHDDKKYFVLDRTDLEQSD